MHIFTNILYSDNAMFNEEALAIRRILFLVDMITKTQFSNSPYDFKIRLFG